MIYHSKVVGFALCCESSGNELGVQVMRVTYANPFAAPETIDDVVMASSRAGNRCSASPISDMRSSSAPDDGSMTIMVVRRHHPGSFGKPLSLCFLLLDHGSLSEKERLLRGLRPSSPAAHCRTHFLDSVWCLHYAS